MNRAGGHFNRTLVDNVAWIDGLEFRIQRGYRYYLTADEGPFGEFIDIPDGFLTNFASTPRIAWAVFPPTGSYAQAAGGHDKLFLAPVIRTLHSARPCRFEETPGLFRDMAKACGTSRIVRGAMYVFLQLGSRPAWDKYRAHDRLVGSTTTLEWASPTALVAFEANAVAERTA